MAPGVLEQIQEVGVWGSKDPPVRVIKCQAFHFYFQMPTITFRELFLYSVRYLKSLCYLKSGFHVTVQGSDYSGCDVVGGFWSQC